MADEIQNTGIQFEDIVPWVVDHGDTGLSARLKLKRNFDKIKAWMDANHIDVDAVKEIIEEYGAELFLSKLNDDTAAGFIEFERGLKSKEITVGEYVEGLVGGDGAYVDEHGNMEASSLRLRSYLETPKLVYNHVDVRVGDEWQTNGAGEIESVEILSDTTGIIHLRLLKDEDGNITEFGTLKQNDRCKGIFHNLEGYNDSETTDNGKGGRTFSGFYTTFFQITGVSGTHNETLAYELRPTVTVNGQKYWQDDDGASSGVRGGFHPCAFMTFAQYSNPQDTTRQSCQYRTTTYMRMLAHMTGWNEGLANVAYQVGNTALIASAFDKPDAGRYSMWLNGDIYFAGTLNRVDSWGRDINDYPDQGNYNSAATYHYNDLVHRDGIVWRNINPSEQGITGEEPGVSSYWVKWIYADSINPQGRWKSVNTPYPVNTVVNLYKGVYIAKRETSNPPLGLLRDKNGRYITTINGGYIIIDEELNDDWELLLDVSDITNGEDGKDAISINLTNDTDSVLTDEQGVISGSLPTTTAQLYDGATLKTEGVQWSIQSASGCTAAINATTGVVTINSMSADSAAVVVAGTYGGATYTKIFTFRKLYGKDKLWLDMPEVVYYDNTTAKNIDPNKLTIKAYITSATKGVAQEVLASKNCGYVKVGGSATKYYHGDQISITYDSFTDGHLIINLFDKNDKVQDTENIQLLQQPATITGTPSITYAVSTQGTNPELVSGWVQSIPQVPEGQYLWTRSIVIYSDGKVETKYSVSHSGEKGDKGDSITKVSDTKSYQVSTSGTVVPTGTWLDEAHKPTPSQGQYLWTRTIILWSDNSITTLYSAERNPNDGQNGESVSVTNQSVQYSKQTAGNLDPTTLQYGSYPSTLSKGDWLYSKTTVTYSDNTQTVTYSVSYIGVDGEGFANEGHWTSSTEVKKNDVYQFGDGVYVAKQDIPLVAENKDKSPVVGLLLNKGGHHLTTKSGGYLILNAATNTTYFDRWVSNGRAANAVRIDLDNENDSMLYDNYGNLLSGNCVSHARCYVGSKVDTSAVFAIADADGAMVSIVNGLITVIDVTKDSTNIVVSCTLAGEVYTSVLTIKRIVNADKFDVVVTPNSVAYNVTDGTIKSGSTIRVEVWRTPADGGSREMIGSLGTYGLTLECVPDLIGSYSQGATITLTNEQAAGNGNIILQLKKDGATIDAESIPIVKSEDGASVIAQYAPNNNPSASQMHDTWQSGDLYMRTKATNDSSWSVWQKVVGENGGMTDYQFAISSKETPEPGRYYPSDISSWDDSPMATTQSKPYLWTKIQKKDGNGNNVGNPSYARLTGEKGESIKGDKGCVARTSEWAIGVYYRNDENTQLADGSVGFIDVVAIEDSSSPDGYKFWQCKESHTSDFSKRPASTENQLWKPVSNVGAIYTSLLIAKNAFIKFGSTNQFIIVNSNSKIEAGLKGDGDIRIWAGGTNISAASDANLENAANIWFKKDGSAKIGKMSVASDGSIAVTNAEVTGVIHATSGSIDGAMKIGASGSLQIGADNSFNMVFGTNSYGACINGFNGAGTPAIFTIGYRSNGSKNYPYIRLNDASYSDDEIQISTNGSVYNSTTEAWAIEQEASARFTMQKTDMSQWCDAQFGLEVPLGSNKIKPKLIAKDVNTQKSLWIEARNDSDAEDKGVDIGEAYVLVETSGSFIRYYLTVRRT